jgi:DNA-binding MarR family transcriptional regulator
MKDKPVEPPLTQQDYVTLATFRYTLRKFIGFSEEAATGQGLTPQQYQALLAIKGAEKVPTVGYVADQLQLRHHTAVELINRLAEHDLVKRNTSATDRRRVELTLTDEGNSKLSQLAGIHREELRRIGPQLRLLLESISKGVS